jgi:hypothetical protein
MQNPDEFRKRRAEAKAKADAAGGQAPLGSSPATPPGSAPAGAPSITPDASMFEKPWEGADLNWEKRKNENASAEERMTNMQNFFEKASPDIQNAITYTMQPGTDAPNKAFANKYLADKGIDVNLLEKVPVGPKPEWLSLAGSGNQGSREEITNIRNFYDTAEPDIQNAIAVLLNPKANEMAQTNAIRHLNNRKVDLAKIKNPQPSGR